MKYATRRREERLENADDLSGHAARVLPSRVSHYSPPVQQDAARGARTREFGWNEFRLLRPKPEESFLT